MSDWMEESTFNFNVMDPNTNIMAPSRDWNMQQINSDLESWVQESSQRTRDRYVPVAADTDEFVCEDDSIDDQFCEEEDSEMSFYEDNESLFQDLSEESEYLDHAVPQGEINSLEDQLALWGQLESSSNIEFQGRVS